MAFTSWMICPKGFPSPLISIHAPRTGSDPTPAMSSWKAAYFNPRSPHGERLLRVVQKLNVLRISIRAPRTGSDNIADQVDGSSVPFQSTLPARGATTGRWAAESAPSDFNPRSPHGERRCYNYSADAAINISIHAPRTGSDHPCASAAAALPHFNPRSPHGERRRPPAAANLSGYFNPRSPHGERPYDLSYYVLHQEISIHAPRTGSDFRDGEVLSAEQLFQSTLPARGATYG